MLYSLYSQTVESEVPLEKFGIKSLKEASTNLIKLEFVSRKFNDIKLSKYKNHQTHASESYGYYYVADLGFFEVFFGNKIVINYFNDIDDDLIHTLLNFPFAILFNQRKKYVIHASSVLFRNKVYCFCGQTQSGKSSLASHLIKLGGFLISEDTCVFDYQSKSLLLLPSYSFLKISDRVNKYKNAPFDKPIKFLKKSTNRKGYILESNKFYPKSKKVDYFIYLDWSKVSTNLKKLDNESSLKMLLSNEFLPYSRNDALFKFKAASMLVHQSDHFLYSRKKDLKTLDYFIDIFSSRYS